MVGQLMEVILYVRDMNAQVIFYRDVLGLKVKEPAAADDFSSLFWVEIDTGPCTLALHAGGTGEKQMEAPKIVFAVEDIVQVREELLRKGVPMGEVRSPAPGVTVCDGEDPEGNPFSIEHRT